MKDINKMTFDETWIEIRKAEKEAEFLKGIDTDRSVLRRKELEEYINSMYCSVIPF